MNKANAYFAYCSNEHNIVDIENKENNPSQQSYIDCVYCKFPSPRRGGINNAAFDGQYLYEKPKPSGNRQITLSKPEAAYYYLDPDYHEPESEYVVHHQPNPLAKFSNHSSNSTKNPKPRKPV